MTILAASGASIERGSLWMALSVPLIGLALTGSVTGLVWHGAYSHEAAGWAAQCTGQDIANLLIYPALAVALIFARDGVERADVVAVGLLAASTYTYAIYVFAIHWSRLWLLDVAVFGLSAYATVLAARAAAPVRILHGRSTGLVLIVVAAIFALLWLSVEVPATLAGTPPAELAKDGLIVNPVHGLDLALLLPAVICAGVLALRGNALAGMLAPAALTTLIAVGIGITALLLVSAYRGLTWSPAVLAVVVTLTFAELTVLLRLLVAP